MIEFFIGVFKMKHITVEDITLKLHALSNEGRREVFDFIEFLLNKKFKTFLRSG